MGEQRQERSATGTPDVPRDEAARETREAQDAHGGSMAPGLVDDTGHPVVSDPSEAAAEDGVAG
ncbi:hypothetical protein [Micromonospora sp. CPCC 205561]|uniref:hypothetical protein n=1 Tax=Micromonospora sp. CPCC 205561 TaxID=3122407 RepID=UPI002FEFA09D